MILSKEWVRGVAQTHGGRYLLPRSIKAGDRVSQTRTEIEWAACQALVDEGSAHWIPNNSTYAPGIRLLGATS